MFGSKGEPMAKKTQKKQKKQKKLKYLKKNGEIFHAPKKTWIFTTLLCLHFTLF